MSDERDTPATGPLTIDDVLDRAYSEPEGPPEAEETEADQTVEEESGEDEPDAPEEAEAEAPEPEEAEEAQVLTLDEYGDVLVRIGDDADPMPLSEIAKGTLRQADYTRKTQELASERKRLEAEATEREQALAEREAAINARLAEVEEPEPDWTKLADELDPWEFNKRRAEWETKRVKTEEARRRAEADFEARKEAFLRKTAEIAREKIPEWTSADAFKENAAGRRQAALDAGFTAEEYDAAMDFRYAVLLEKARRFDALQKGSPEVEKKVRKAPKVLKPGASQGSKADREAAEKAATRKKLAKPHSMKDRLRLMGYE